MRDVSAHQRACAPGPAAPRSRQMRPLPGVSDPDVEAMSEVALELGAQHLLRRRLDVVLDALELEALRVAVVDRVARAVVVVPRLSDRADAHDVLATLLELEVHRG